MEEMQKRADAHVLKERKKEIGKIKTTRCRSAMDNSKVKVAATIKELGLHDFDKVYSESNASARLEEEALVDFDNMIADRFDDDKETLRKLEE